MGIIDKQDISIENNCLMRRIDLVDPRSYKCELQAKASLASRIN